MKKLLTLSRIHVKNPMLKVFANLSLFLFLLSIGCANNEPERTDNSGSCTHSVLSGNYSQSDCTGTSSNLQLKSYCQDVSDVSYCKTYTSCNNGFYYNDLQLSNKGKSCVANGYPLACTGGTYKVSSLSNCP